MKKLICIVLALCMAAALAACGGSSSSGNNSTTAANNNTASANNAPAAGTEASASGSSLTTIEAGKLTISTSPDFPPFEYTDDSGNVIGIEPELMKLICDKLGLELQIDAMDFNSALLAAENGKSDAVVSGVTVREDRKALFDFTTSYTTITQAIVSKEGSGITMENLGSYRIGVQSGTTGQEFVEEDFGQDTVFAYDTYSLVFQALNNGQVDCIVMDDAVAKAYIASNPGLTMTNTTYSPEEYAFGFHKGNEALVNAVNSALAELMADGTVDSIISKYMTE
ncbi:MAG: amino acid ABC transporter substrate-binding protein [Oscillospiraceae bacterium]|nr:amino acid ABC transporter substrate-binding protein [Oscillospiraceae bacterium]